MNTQEVFDAIARDITELSKRNADLSTEAAIPAFALVALVVHLHMTSVIKMDSYTSLLRDFSKIESDGALGDGLMDLADYFDRLVRDIT